MRSKGRCQTICLFIFIQPYTNIYSVMNKRKIKSFRTEASEQIANAEVNDLVLFRKNIAGIKYNAVIKNNQQAATIALVPGVRVFIRHPYPALVKKGQRAYSAKQFTAGCNHPAQ